MTNNTILIVLGLALILGSGGLVYWQKKAAMEEAVPSENSNESSDSGPSTSSNNGDDDENEMEDEFEDEGATPPAESDTTISSHGFTMAEVAMHSSAQSCWSAINGNVYDLTSWIPNHPGGPDKILQLCGTDGSAKFNAKHGGSPQQAAVLAGFIIGVVKN